MGRQIDPAVEDRVVALLCSGMTNVGVAAELSIGEATVRRIRRRRNVTVNKDPRPGKKVTSTLGEKGGQLDIEVTHEKDSRPRWLDIKSPEKLLKACDVDPKEWAVKTCRVSSSEVTVKLRKTVGKCTADQSRVYTNMHISCTLERRTPAEQAIETLCDRLIARKYRPPKVKYRSLKKDPVMLEWCPFDQHHGLLAWKPEVEAHWDLKISDAFFDIATTKVIEKASPYNVKQILVPIGNDWFHCNDPTFQTPKGKHRLDIEGRLIKVYESGFWSLFRGIERLRQIAPVHLIWVPGNHDEQTSYFLARELAAHYMDVDGGFRRGVTVDTGARSRKLYTWGNSAIGFSHPMNKGMWEKQRGIFAELFKKEWADADHHEIHTGHLHKIMELQYMQADTLGSHTVVRMLPSLCASDKWHYEMGFLDKNRASASFIWSENEGLVCQFTTRVSDEEAQR
jgi:hypothetical protein